MSQNYVIIQNNIHNINYANHNKQNMAIQDNCHRSNLIIVKHFNKHDNTINEVQKGSAYIIKNYH